MPIQAPSWTDFLSCPICYNEFNSGQRVPISLGCGHTMCRGCLQSLPNRQCPFDQTTLTADVLHLPVNTALLQLVSNGSSPSTSSGCSQNNGRNPNSVPSTTSGTETPPGVRRLGPEEYKCYKIAKECTENLALHLRSFVSNFGSPLSRPMQRKLVTLINCQLIEEEGRIRAIRAARSLGERTVTELILQHQNPQQLSSNLWASVRSRGCQFLGPAMQEDVLKLVLQALQDGSALSRKVLVMFVVQRLESSFPQASKTSIGHVVQLLYRASCFKVSKREADSSLMQLKEEFRTYEALRREHDAQIVQIATEAGLRIAPDQWSSLLYGDTMHKSHMQSIIDKLQTPSSFAQSIQELVIALQRTGDPTNLEGLRTHLKELASIDPSLENATPTWEELAKALDAVHQVVIGLVEFMQQHGNRKIPDCGGGQGCNPNTKYKISLCRDLTMRRVCPRGTSCTFAHSEEELERYRAKSRKSGKSGNNAMNANASNASASKKENFQSHHHSGHSGHTRAGAVSVAAGLLHAGDEISTPVSTGAPASIRYTTSTAHKSGRSSSIAGSNSTSRFCDNTSSAQSMGALSQATGSHHIHSLHHSPTNCPLLNAGNNAHSAQQALSAAVSMGQHRQDSSTYNSLNYTAPSPRMQPLIQSSGNTNVNSTVVSTNNYSVLPFQNSQLIQQSQTPQTSLAKVNTTKAQNLSSSSGFGTVLNNKGYHHFYEMCGINPNTNYYNSAAATTTTTANNNTSVPDTELFYGTKKLHSPESSIWEQRSQTRSAVPSSLEQLNSSFSLNPNAIYDTLGPEASTTFYQKKQANVAMEMKNQVSPQSNTPNAADSYIYKNAFNGSGTPNATSAVTILNSGLNTNNVNNVSYGYSQTANIMSPDNISAGQINPHFYWSSRPTRDNDIFSRPASSLNEEGGVASYDGVAGLGTKFGPICPVYKDYNSSSLSTTNNCLEPWSTASGQVNKPLSIDHSLLDEHPSHDDIHCSMFSNQTNPQQSRDLLANSIEVAFSKFIGITSDKSPNIEGNDMDFAMNGLHIGDSIEDNSKIEKNCAVNDGTATVSVWEHGIAAAKNCWYDTEIVNAKSREEQQHQFLQHHLLMQRSGRVNGERGINDLENSAYGMEIDKIVKNVWSCDEQSGNKLE